MFFLHNELFSGVDSVGTVAASLVTYSSIQVLKPDIIINAGTAGGFKVYLLITGITTFQRVIISAIFLKPRSLS